jgi:hypothetical protein
MALLVRDGSRPEQLMERLKDQGYQCVIDTHVHCRTLGQRRNPGFFPAISMDYGAISIGRRNSDH